MELIGAVKRELPSFDGTAPDTGNTVDRIIKALQRFLHEQKIEATVTHMASQDDPGSPAQEHVFTVNGVPLPICTINFPGAKNITEAKLSESSKELRDSEYSRKFVSSFAQNNLIPLYREVGQLKAAFSPPLAKPEATATCKSGVELTIPVDEGLHLQVEQSRMDRKHSVNSTGTRSAYSGCSQASLQTVVKLDQAPQAIQKAYGRKGFLGGESEKCSRV